LDDVNVIVCFLEYEYSCRNLVTILRNLVINVTGREADHSPPFSAEVKNRWSYASTHPYVFLAGA
jgi:hypothetical protein